MPVIYLSDLPITAELLCRIGGPVQSSKRGTQQVNAAILAAHLPALMSKFAIDSPLRIAHFLSQLAHESDSFCALEEYASGAAYEGRTDLGNVQKGDGRRFKGRGPIQLTGRANYRAFTKWVRKFLPEAPNFEENPELVATDQWAAWSAIYYWETHDLNRYADADDVITVTRVINGGRNGLDDRKVKLARAKAEVAKLMAQATAPGDRPTLHRGMYDNPDVEQLQRLLSKFVRVAIDGDFGPGTEGALKAAQARFGLLPTGIADAATWSALSGD